MKGDGSIEKFSICEQDLRMLYGDFSVDEICKKLLTKENSPFEENIFEIIEKKHEIYEFFLKSLITNDKN